MPETFIVGPMEEVGKWDKKQGGGGRCNGGGYRKAFRKGEGGLGDFAAICLQLSSSVLCGRTGGWWPPYFC